jgi:hypothetical protein
MPDSPTTSGLPAGADVSPWWHLWAKNQQWRENLAKRAAHKSLDVPEDDMVINAPRTETRNGLGPLAAVALTAAGGVPSAILAGYMMMNRPAPPAAGPPDPGKIKLRVWHVGDDGQPFKAEVAPAK